MKRFLLFIVAALLLAFSAYAETVVKIEVDVAFSDVTRTGLYTGEVNEQGHPDGFGVFEATNSIGYKYVYVGNWLDGKLNGTAWRVMEDGYMEYGEYVDNIFVSGIYSTNAVISYYDINNPTPSATEKPTREPIVIQKDEKLSYVQATLVSKDGKTYLAVEFEYINMKDYSTSASSTWMRCYQDGFQLNTAYSWDFPEFSFDTPIVRPNTTYTFYIVYELRNNHPVELVDDSIYSDTVITIYIS